MLADATGNVPNRLIRSMWTPQGVTLCDVHEHFKTGALVLLEPTACKHPIEMARRFRVSRLCDLVDKHGHLQN